MSRVGTVITLLGLLTGGTAQASSDAAPVSSSAWFNPNGIALSFTRTSEVVEIDDAWEGPALAPFRFQPTADGGLVMRLVAGKATPAVRVEVVRDDVLRWSGMAVAVEFMPISVRVEVARIQPTHTILHATGFEAEEALLPGLTRLRHKLFFSVGAYSGTAEDNHGADARWDGLGGDEFDNQGRTFNAGTVRGDLTLSVGTVGTDTTLAQVFNGEAGVLSLNPFRDVSAQFDLAILGSGTSSWSDQSDLRVFVLRVRAAYVGAFDHLQGPASTDSELGVAFGVKW